MNNKPLNFKKFNLFIFTILGVNVSTEGLATKNEVKCPTCGSSLPLNPEDVIITCQYCATSFTAGRNKVKQHTYFPAVVSLKQAEDNIYEYLRKKLRFRGWKAYKGIILNKILLPYWVVSYQANTRYRGYRRTTRTETEHYTDSEGNRRTRQKQVTVYEPVDNTINVNTVEPLLCRSGIRIFGLQKLNNTILQNLGSQNAEEFSSDKLLDAPENIKFLSGEILSMEAKELVETAVQDRHRATAHANTTELFDCRTFVQVQGMSFLHYPIITGEYSYGNHTYRVLMDAHTGTIIDAEFPVTLRQRMINYGITGTLLISGAVLTLLNNKFDPDGNLLGAFITGQIIAGILIFFTNKTVWATHTRR